LALLLRNTLIKVRGMVCLGSRQSPILIQGLIVLCTLLNSFVSIRWSPTTQEKSYQEFEHRVKSNYLESNTQPARESRNETSSHQESLSGVPLEEELKPLDRENPNHGQTDRKRDEGKRGKWKHRKRAKPKKLGHIHLPLKIPFPVFIPSLPKR
jgi:hypothetical protein